MNFGANLLNELPSDITSAPRPLPLFRQRGRRLEIDRRLPTGVLSKGTKTIYTDLLIFTSNPFHCNGMDLR